MEKYIFKNYGGSYQLSIDTPEELQNITRIDEALWAATSIPINILNTDKNFLQYIDIDKNGRIRTDEIKAAVGWLFMVLKDRSGIADASDTIFLDAINTDIQEGKILAKTARRVLSNLRVTDNSDRITLNQVRNIQGIMADSATNGDGVITPEDTADKELSELITLIMHTEGSATDASGKPGIGRTEAGRFFSNIKLYLSWIDKGRIPEGEKRTDIMTWGVETPNAFKALKNAEGKLDEFFAQCAVTRFDGRVRDSLKLRQKELDEANWADRQHIIERLKTAPLSEPNAEAVLYFDEKINMLFTDIVNTLKNNVLEKIYGPDLRGLTQDQWEEVKGVFSSYRQYIEGKTGGKFEKIPEEDLKKYIAGDFNDRINALIERDLAVAKQIQHIQDVEKLILFQKHLMELANNSVSFANIYNPELRSFFEAGTLIIDGRKIPFTMLTTDRNAHKKTAMNSNVYLMYLEITSSRDGSSRFEIAAAVTSGDSGTLRLGKRGIFFTRDGKAWDAEVIDIVMNPIGLLESVKAPFIKFADMIRTQVEKFAKARETKMETTMIAPSGASMARDLLVGGGVALAALGSSFAYITKAVSQVRITHFLTTIGIITFLILFPSLIMGIIKLRRRNLGILFEASGCAINVRMKLNVGLGKIFTFIPPYPPGSQKKKLDIISQLARDREKATAKNTWYKRLLKVTLATIAICLVSAFILWLAVYRKP